MGISNINQWTKLLLSYLFFIITACHSDNPSVVKSESSKGKDVVHVYSARNYEVDKELYRQFEEETGIRVILKQGKGAELIQEIKAAGKDVPADLLICMDVGQLQEATKSNLFEAIKKEALDEKVPLRCRNPESYWFGLAKRARVFVYNKEQINATALSNYSDLAAENWKGKVLISPSTHISNRSLLASIIANKGKENAAIWCKGMTANLAKNSKGGDLDQIQAVADGNAAVAIANTNTIAKFYQLQPEKSRNLGVFFPNQASSGTHVNFSGAGICKNAAHAGNAVKLLIFLASEKAQEQLTKQNYEYPVNPAVSPTALLLSWGLYKEDLLDVNFLQSNHAVALELLGVASW